jgi:hypothetical protein
MSTSYHPPEASGRTTPAGSAPPPEPLGGFEERLLADLKVAMATQAAACVADDAAAERPARPARRVRQAARPGLWPVQRLAMTGAASAVIAAAVAVALTATSSTTPGGHPVGGRPTTDAPGGHSASAWPNTAVAGVLHNAALAALEVPANAPRPGQFIYTKLYRSQQEGGTAVLQTWLSADGVQAGMVSGGTAATTGYSPGCRNGLYYYPNFPHSRSTQRCTHAENAAYFPDMPTSPGALRAWLQRHLGGGASYANGLLTSVEFMMTSDYLLPRQQAALYEVLAQTRGLTVVPKVTNARGVTGIGIRSDVVDKGFFYTIIFDPRTYAPLGMNWAGTYPTPSGPVKDDHNGEVLLKLAIVNKLGQRP